MGIIRHRARSKVFAGEHQFVIARIARDKRRYMARTLASATGSLATLRNRAAAWSRMNGLFMTNSCCKGVVVVSRLGLCMVASGKP